MRVGINPGAAWWVSAIKNVTGIVNKRFYQRYTDTLGEITRDRAKRIYDAYVHLPVEFDMERDGYRPVSEKFRRVSDELLIESLENMGIPYRVVGGSIPDRLEQIIKYFDLPQVMSIEDAITQALLDFEKLLGRYGEPRKPRRMLSFLNLDHIGGINTLLHSLANGGAIVTVPERSPDAVFAAIAAYKVEVLPTTPTFLNMVLLSGAHERHDTGNLRLITYGTEPMPPQTLRSLNAALPHVRFRQTYGLSELGILPVRSKSDDSLWVKLGGPGFEYKIIDGILWIRSDLAMLGYLNAPAPFDEDGFFDTQDMVETDGEYVRILGRRSEIINVCGEKVYPSEVENVLLQAPNIADATVSGYPSHLTGMVVKAKIRPIVNEDEQIIGPDIERGREGVQIGRHT
jgi:acyl-CoA synthetase (AMP-forming)/AMP-acid ligase II